MSAMASQITSVSIVCPAVCSGADHRNPQSYASLAFVRGIDRWPVNFPHNGLVSRKIFPLDDVIMGVVIAGHWMTLHVIGWRHHGCCHCSAIERALMCLKSPTTRLFFIHSTACRVGNKENVKCVRGSTFDRRITLTKEQQRRKRFHVMTSC